MLPHAESRCIAQAAKKEKCAWFICAAPVPGSESVSQSAIILLCHARRRSYFLSQCYIKVLPQTNLYLTLYAMPVCTANLFAGYTSIISRRIVPAKLV